MHTKFINKSQSCEIFRISMAINPLQKLQLKLCIQNLLMEVNHVKVLEYNACIPVKGVYLKPQKEE